LAFWLLMQDTNNKELNSIIIIIIIIIVTVVVVGSTPIHRILLHLYEMMFEINYTNYVFLQTLVPLILSHFPAGSSLKSWVHYGQEMKSGKS
jgi:hypothetical protein